MADFLDKIVAYKKTILENKKETYENLKNNLGKANYTRYGIFKKAIAKSGQVNLIAEIKKASPSRGVIREDFDVAKLAKIYVDNKAAAISVLTEDKYFLGKPAYLKKVSEECRIPTLMKDFVIHEYQIYEAAYCGASAVLLIVAILKDEELRQFIQLAATLDLDCLVEVHNEAELERALNAGADIIGINNRNLDTLMVDTSTCLRLIPHIPKEKVIVAESGLKTHDDIKQLQAAGAHAALIGETFMASPDVAAKIKEVMYGQN